jgi:hypothetical protein
MTLTRPRLALAGVVTLVALTGCSGGSSDPSSSAAGSDTADRGAAARVAAPADGSLAEAQVASGSGGEVPSSLVEQQAVVKKGDLAIHTRDPQRARERVDALLARVRGSVADEQTTYDKQGRITDSHLALRVPVATFSRAMTSLEGLGTVVSSTSNAQDVTTEVIDEQQRLRTLRISLHDLNAFQKQAANIDQLLRFESAITQRRGEYQSLKAQRAHLVDQARKSTIDLELSVPPTHEAVGPVHHAGFVTGLRHGWRALTDTVLVGLTVVGAALPFAVAIAVVGLPLWWVVRRRIGLGENAEHILDTHAGTG